MTSGSIIDTLSKRGILVSLGVHGRKLLWAKAGNRCSYRYEGEVCDEELVTSDGGKITLVGEECHIVGEKPTAARYIADFHGRNTGSEGGFVASTRETRGGDDCQQVEVCHPRS